MKFKKAATFILLVSIALNFVFVQVAFAEGEVYFECENLKSALTEILGKGTITAEDIEGLDGKLDLSYKNISSLTGLENAANLDELILSYNSITDMSPIAGLNNLKSLYLDHNWISKLPEETGLTALEHLDISGNPIEVITAGFLKFSNLKRLYIGQLMLGEMPDLSSVAPTLQRLDVTGMRFENMEFVSGMANLELLVMNDCALTALPDLSRMQNLSYLYFTDNLISSLPDYLGSLPLKRLDFSGNLVSQMPEGFENLKSLEQLVFTDNYFSALPAAVTRMESLEVLMCGQNIISEVPGNMFDLKNIKRASFASNDLRSLEKFRDFSIPYSYQISFDLNYLDLTDETNIEVLEDYHNDGGRQKSAVLSAQVVSTDTQGLVIDCSFDTAELGRVGENAGLYAIKLFAAHEDGLKLVGQTDLMEQGAELSVEYLKPPQGVADYLVCLVVLDETWPGRYIKYTARISSVETVTAVTPEPVMLTPTETVSPVHTVIEEPSVEKETDTKYLLYILLVGVIMIISAIVIHFVKNRRK